MGLDSKVLGFDLNSCFSSPKSFSDLLTQVSLIDDIPKKLSILNEYVYLLEQELRKVDAFKRELPLSMILLNDAIVKLKEEVLQLKRRGVEVVAKEKFMPFNGNSDEKNGADASDKKNWMRSAQLWINPVTPVQCENSFAASRVPDSVSLLQAKDGVTRMRGRLEAGDLKKKGGVKREVNEDLAADRGLSLFMPPAEMRQTTENPSKGRMVPSSGGGNGEDSSSEQQSKKQRRCWSHELHQNFVNALQHLGGAQVATPKQIREIMRVDGLTNDEVKSHLQKYRLHVRKLQPIPPGALMSNLEQYWLNKIDEFNRMPPLLLSGSPEGPLNLGVSAAKGVSVEVEEEEDVKSESQSWIKGRFCRPS